MNKKDVAAKEWCSVYDGEMNQVITEFVSGAMRGMKQAYLSGWEECARQESKESPGTASNTASAAIVKIADGIHPIIQDAKNGYMDQVVDKLFQIQQQLRALQ